MKPTVNQFTGFLQFWLSFTVKITILFYSVVHKSFKVVHYKKLCKVIVIINNTFVKT